MWAHFFATPIYTKMPWMFKYREPAAYKEWKARDTEQFREKLDGGIKFLVQSLNTVL